MHINDCNKDFARLRNSRYAKLRSSASVQKTCIWHPKEPYYVLKYAQQKNYSITHNKSPICSVSSTFYTVKQSFG